MKHYNKRLKDGLQSMNRNIANMAIAVWRRFSIAAVTLTVISTAVLPVSVAGVGDSNIVKGTEKLIGDLTTWLMVLAPVVAGMLIIYFCIRRSAADETDQKRWNNRIVAAVVSCIGAVLGSATLNLILGYFS